MPPTGDVMPTDSAPTPRGSTLTARAQQALLDLANAKDRQRGEDEMRAITTACKTAEQCTAHLRLVDTVRRDLLSLGVAVGEPRRPDAAKARRHLRSLATRVTDPSVELTDRLTSKSLDDVWDVARRTAKAAERALYEAADEERQRLRPDDLGELAAPVSGSTAMAVTRIRRTFDQAAKDIAVEQLPSAVRRWRAGALEWEDIRKVVAEAMSTLHPEVQAFLDAATAVQGAPWPLVTEAVREWLDRDENGDGYVMRRTHG
jgi:hypothetical protein